MTSTTADVAIIGGGLMGCFSAYFLRQQGRSVVVIEKARVCAAASAVNFGNLRLQGRNPAEFPLSLRAHEIWEDLDRLTGEDCGVIPCGHVYLGFAPSDQPKLERAARMPAPQASTWTYSMGRPPDAAGPSCRRS